MRTIRGRLTIGYAISLSVTLFVFAATIYRVQNPEPFAELDDRLRVESDLIANVLFVSAIAGPVVVFDSALGREILAPRVSELFESVQDYILVVEGDGDVLYAAAPPASLTVTGDTVMITGAGRAVEGGLAVGETRLDALMRLASGRGGVTPGDEEGMGLVDMGDPLGELRYRVRRVDWGTRNATILLASPTAGAPVGPGRLLMGMLVAGPIILVASTLVGYWLAGRTMTPMDTIIDEIEAITDGRSLHRRVVNLKSTEELARLSSTLNNMLVRLERSFLSLRRFTADASHELKTPLTVLRSGIERAITHPRAHPDVLALLEETLIEVNRMAELVDSLLMLARVDEGRVPLHLEPVDIRELLSEVAETASILGEQARVNVEVDLPAAPLVAAIDRHRIRQLFMNLLTNAIKYTARGGLVTISCRERDGEVVFAVRDTGIGIASSELPHVFDRFWRADIARSRTGQRPGVGLGLAICKWIAEAHGGTISADSRRGEGSTFRVTLPTGPPDVA